MGIHFDHHRTAQRRFVSQEAQQFGVTPPCTSTVCLPGFLGTVLPAAPFGAVTDSSQFLDADKGMGKGVEDLDSKRRINVSNKPSFSARQLYQTAHSGTSAFLLKTFAGFGVPLRFAECGLTRLEKSFPRGVRCSGKVAHSHVHPHHLFMGSGFSFRQFKGQRNQKEILLFGLAVPEFACPNFSPLRDVFKVLSVAFIGQDHAAIQGGNTHLLAFLERVIALVLIAQGARNELGRVVQSLIPLGFGVDLTRCLTLFDLRPESFVGGSNVTRYGAGHLSAQPEPFPQSCVYLFLNLGSVAGFIHFKRLLGREVQRITVSQSHGVQSLLLLWGMPQLQLGSERNLH